MRKNKLFQYISMAAVCLFMTGTWMTTVGAEETTTSSASAIMNLDYKEPTGFIKYQSSGKNPFGTKEGVPFRLVTENELGFYSSFDTESGNKTSNITSTVYDGWKGIENIEDTFAKDNFSSKRTKYSKKSLSFMKGTAIKSKKSQRDDAIVYVGVNPKGAMCVWKQNIADNTDTASGVVQLNSDSPFDIVAGKTFSTSSIFSDDRAQYEANSMISITSGDYNGDGEDHIVVAYSADSMLSGAFYNLIVVQELNQDLQVVAKKTFIGKRSDKQDKDRDKMGVSLSTGNYNEDRIEDLSILTYYGRQDYNSTATPDLYVIRGAEDTNILDCAMNAGERVRRSDGKATIFGPSITSGDVNGDGIDEIVFAGHNVNMTDDSKPDYDEDHVNVGYYAMRNSTGTPIVKMDGFYQVEASIWTQDAVFESSDDIWDSIGLSCVAINGKSTAECIFVSGTLYRINSRAEFEEIYKPQFFKYRPASNAYIASTAPGVYDGNTYNREQLVMTVGYKQAGSDDYSFYTVMIGGKGYKDQEYSTFVENCGEATDYYTDFTGNSGIYYGNTMGKSTADFENKGDDLKEQVNCLVVPVDTDEDGLMASYDRMGYGYSHPKVEAVLQASPRFEELEQDGGYTTYSESVSYGKTNGTSTTSSWCLGLNASFKFPLVEKFLSLDVQLESGYVSETTKSFAESMTKSYGTSFSSVNDNTVVVKRTPIYTFRYKLAQDNSKWSTTDKDYLDYTVIQDPVYFQMTVDEYNKYVDEFNASIVARNAGKQETDDTYVKPLHKLNEDYLKENEGDPTKYPASFRGGGFSLSASNNQCGHASSVIESDYSVEAGHEESTETSDGFHFLGSAGLSLFEDTGGGGMYYGYDRSSGTSVTTSSSLTTDTSGSVCGIDKKGLMASMKYSEKTLDAFDFTWTFGEHRVVLNGDGSETPVYGYALTGVTRPAKAPENVQISGVENRKLTLTWEQGANKDEDIKGYNVYQVEDGEYTKINTDIITEETYNVSGLESGTRYTYVVTAVTKSSNTHIDGVDSIWSDKAAAKTTSVNYNFEAEITDATMKVAVDGGESKDYNPSEHGTFEQGTELELSFSSNQKKTLNYLEVIKGEKTDRIYLGGMKDKALIEIDADTKVVLHTKDVVTNSHLTFGVYKGSGTDGKEHGSIRASVGGVEVSQPGAEITGNHITFKVTPDDGYVLKSWVVPDLIGPGVEIPAQGETSLDYYFTDQQTSIYALFVKETDPEVSIKLKTNAKNGSIQIKDNTGKVYKTNEDGNVYVIKNRLITMTAEPNQYHTFLEWTDDASDYENAEKITMYATADMTIGATFYVPVRYQLFYSKLGYVNKGENGGEMEITYTDPENPDKTEVAPDTGNLTYIPYTKMSAHLKADEGYRIKTLTVTQGGVRKIIEMDPGTKTYDYPFEMTGNTTFYPTYERTYEVVVTDSEAEDNGSKDACDIKENVTIKAGKKEGYTFAGWKINKGDPVLEDPGKDTTSFAMPEKDVHVKALWEKHEHTYEDLWSKDKTNHWHKATCGHDVVSGKATHTASDWVIDKKATTTAAGSRYKACTVCGYVMARETIPKVAINIPELFMVKGNATKNSIKITWENVKNAAGYDVFTAKCGGKYKKKASISAKKKRTWTQKDLKRSTCYKYKVKAYRYEKGKKRYIKTSICIHIATRGGSFTNGKTMKVNMKSLTLKVKQTKQIKASVTKVEKNKKLIYHIPKIAYKTSNSKVLSISKKGKITGKKPGTCYVYVHAANGVYQKIKVTVK